MNNNQRPKNRTLAANGLKQLEKEILFNNCRNERVNIAKPNIKKKNTVFLRNGKFN